MNILRCKKSFLKILGASALYNQIQESRIKKTMNIEMERTMVIAKGRQHRVENCYLIGIPSQFCKMNSGDWVHNNVTVL